MFQNRSHRITAYCNDAQFAAWAGGDLAQHRGRNGKVLGQVTGARLIHCAATGTGGYVDKGNLGAGIKLPRQDGGWGMLFGGALFKKQCLIAFQQSGKRMAQFFRGRRRGERRYRN